MPRVFSLAPVFILLGAQQEVGEFKYLPDHPGKAKANVTVTPLPDYRLGPAERSAFAANLARLRDLLLAQPAFNPPRGVEVSGFLAPACISLPRP